MATVVTFVALLHQVLPIPIINGGFETDEYPIPDNTYRYSSAAVTGWKPYDPNNIISNCNWCIGLINPRSGTAYYDTTFGSGTPEGIQALWLEPKDLDEPGNGEFGITQTLTNTVLEVDTTYILTVYIGNEDNNCWSQLSTDGVLCTTREGGQQRYKVVLLTDSTIIAQDDNTLYIDEGQWRLSTIQYQVLPDDPLIGSGPLMIRLLNKNDGNDVSYTVHFDDVQLSAQQPSKTLTPTAAPTEVTQDPTYISTPTPSAVPSKQPSKSIDQSPTHNTSPSPTEITKLPSNPLRTSATTAVTQLSVHCNDISKCPFGWNASSTSVSTFNATYISDETTKSSLIIVYIGGSIALFCVCCFIVLIIWKTVTQRKWDPEPHDTVGSGDGVPRHNAPYLDDVNDESDDKGNGLEIVTFEGPQICGEPTIEDGADIGDVQHEGLENDVNVTTEGPSNHMCASRTQC